MATAARASDHCVQQRPRKRQPRMPPVAAPHANGRVPAADDVQNAMQSQPQPHASDRTGDGDDGRRGRS
ncbi:hypothetical protein B296_00046465 [Ensete ventricosum]|uniref:Uncharacterized protein n=1 Tax=Ensete ventricosum TaxID=4639 RepID=A0A426X766_ENSVE|nr:hypothetical protein B296_00046465 [Ensete ventricosum]